MAARASYRRIASRSRLRLARLWVVSGAMPRILSGPDDAAGSTLAGPRLAFDDGVQPDPLPQRGRRGRRDAAPRRAAAVGRADDDGARRCRGAAAEDRRPPPAKGFVRPRDAGPPSRR